MSAAEKRAAALEAIRAGATDFIAKPFTPEEIDFVIKKVLQRGQPAVKVATRSGQPNKSAVREIVGRSRAMQEVFDTIKRLENFSTTVLIKGESGTGKEIVARALHANSPRAGQAFVAVNCGAIPETLIESELFGHAKGSFTDATRDKRGLFEEANGGTIFLDEVGELPLHLQVKLLRVLQERQIRPVGAEALIPVDVRVIAATLRDLEEDVAQGNFRDDLYYRLNVVEIIIPPLRDRPEDIPALAQHFIEKLSSRLGSTVTRIDEQALQCLTEYDWRGNVRELENAIEHAIVLTESPTTITVEALPERAVLKTVPRAPRGSLLPVDACNLSIKAHTRNLEIDLIQRALEKTAGNRTHAAKILEISHRALLYKIKEYGIG
jgi:two-component system response regulator AtoC